MALRQSRREIASVITSPAFVRSLASLSGITMPSSRNLWDIMKKEHIEHHDPKHIRDIWMEFHADPSKHRVASVITAPTYLSFAESAAQNPMFVLPVFRGGPNSFETFILQCQLPYVLFTSLEDYKRNGSAATPHFVLTHYTELLHSKGIALVRGDIVKPGSIDIIQAMSLLSNCHEYYADRGGAKAGFLYSFNHRQNEFDFKRMLDSMGHATDSDDILMK